MKVKIYAAHILLPKAKDGVYTILSPAELSTFQRENTSYEQKSIGSRSFTIKSKFLSSITDVLRELNSDDEQYYHALRSVYYTEVEEIDLDLAEEKKWRDVLYQKDPLMAYAALDDDDQLAAIIFAESNNPDAATAFWRESDERLEDRDMELYRIEPCTVPIYEPRSEYNRRMQDEPSSFCELIDWLHKKVKDHVYSYHTQPDGVYFITMDIFGKAGQAFRSYEALEEDMHFGRAPQL